MGRDDRSGAQAGAAQVKEVNIAMDKVL